MKARVTVFEQKEALLKQTVYESFEEALGNHTLLCSGRKILKRSQLPKPPSGWNDWQEVTFDTGDQESIAFLKSRNYVQFSTFSVCVTSAEVSHMVARDSPYGLPPSMYAVVEHGDQIRASYVEVGTRTPIFTWSTGQMQLIDGEPVTIKLLRTPNFDQNLSSDQIIGQAWISPAAKEARLDLGSNIGLMDIKVDGPYLRRRHVDGWCMGCMPSPGVLWSRFLRRLVILTDCGCARVFCCVSALGFAVATQGMPRDLVRGSIG